MLNRNHIDILKKLIVNGEKNFIIEGPNLSGKKNIVFNCFNELNIQYMLYSSDKINFKEEIINSLIIQDFFGNKKGVILNYEGGKRFELKSIIDKLKNYKNHAIFIIVTSIKINIQNITIIKIKSISQNQLFNWVRSKVKNKMYANAIKKFVDLYRNPEEINSNLPIILSSNKKIKYEDIENYYKQTYKDLFYDFKQQLKYYDLPNKYIYTNLQTPRWIWENLENDYEYNIEELSKNNIFSYFSKSHWQLYSLANYICNMSLTKQNKTKKPRILNFNYKSIKDIEYDFFKKNILHN